MSSISSFPRLPPGGQFRIKQAEHVTDHVINMINVTVHSACANDVTGNNISSSGFVNLFLESEATNNTHDHLNNILQDNLSVETTIVYRF